MRKRGRRGESGEEGCHVLAVSPGIRNSEPGSYLGRCQEESGVPHPLLPPQPPTLPRVGGGKGQKNRSNGSSHDRCHVQRVGREASSRLSILCALFH